MLSPRLGPAMADMFVEILRLGQGVVDALKEHPMDYSVVELFKNDRPS